MKNCQRARATCLATVYLEKQICIHLYTFVLSWVENCRNDENMSKASDTAYEKIKSLILNNELRPGEQIKEEELAEKCGVSRTPIRDALVRLEADFLVEKRDNQRSFVANPDRDDIDELFTLRAMLEGHAAARAAERSTPALVARLRNSMKIVQKDQSVKAFLEHNAEFHRIILDAAGSKRLASMLERLISQAVVYHTANAYSAEQISQSISEHKELVEAIAKGDGEWARSVISGHIRRAFHVYSEALSGVDVGHNGTAA